MTRAQYAARARTLCYLVNSRRMQGGKEPLRQQAIMRVVRLAVGPEPALSYPDKRAPVSIYDRIPYALTEMALHYFATGKTDG